ncbi:hypothetical protein [Alkalinema sp. FACHB-956]|uniref:HD domain-containing protein n=1 Tax=Alkalinema sp. FACHB-956 TaxID=2692768 RepID=UPI00168728B3|nr:hypothetical protein [Alkalinema sp. FACHB-956]MBD2326166.1 hypothetical protein [Alkalinema sp. FACHB-956]
MKMRWYTLLKSWAVKDREITKTYQEIVNAYSESHRHYHTLPHIAHVLDTLETLRPKAQDWLALQCAAWFHDIVYDPTQRTNEAESAAVAQGYLEAWSIDRDRIHTIKRLILATQDHRIPDDLPDAALLLDADLAILGSAPQDYDRYAAAIRREYDWVSLAEYQQGRIAVLQNFLQRDRIYHTNRLFADLEQAARHNLQTEIHCHQRSLNS